MQNHSDQIIGITTIQRGLYILEFHIYPTLCNFTDNNSHELWHSRLGHVSNASLKSISRILPFIYFKPNLSPFDSFHNAKQKRLSFTYNNFHTTSLFDLLHVALWGPCSTLSIIVQTYFLILVDDFTRYNGSYSLKLKTKKT